MDIRSTRTLAIVVLVASLAGCTQTVSDVATRNRVKINQLYLGMDREQVDRVMGPGSVKVRKVEPFSSTQMTNPHKTETVRGKSGWNLFFENVDRSQLHYRYQSDKPTLAPQ